MAAVVFLAVYIKKIDPFKMIILCGIAGIFLFR
jgi:hypothetical protein